MTAQRGDPTLARLRAERDARRALAAEDMAPIPAAKSLDKFLEESDKPPEWQIKGLLHKRGNNVMIAQRKAGKTTVRNNLVRSLADGDDFLGIFEANKIGRNVGILDLEMDEDQSRLWLRRQGIRNTQKVKTWHLKGKVSSFGILNPERRAEWAAEIRARGIGFLILDTLAPALTANGLTESNEDISAFLAAWDELCQQAGVDGSLIIHHMGLSGEHGRGASRLADWNTAEWKLVRKGQGTDSDDLFAPRYFSAYGRDIHYKEARLGFDGNTKRLIIDGGSRKDDAMEDLRPAFLDYVKINPGCVGKDLKEHLTGDDKTIRLTDQSLENRGLICIHKAGEYNTAPRHHYLVADCPDPDYHKRLKVVK